MKRTYTTPTIEQLIGHTDHHLLAGSEPEPIPEETTRTVIDWPTEYGGSGKTVGIGVKDGSTFNQNNGHGQGEDGAGNRAKDGVSWSDWDD